MSFLLVGEALVDVVTDSTGATRERPGGSPANVAVGLGRLGEQVQLLTALGEDARGAAVRAHLEASRVTVGAARSAATAVALAQLDADGAASYTFEIDWDLAAAPTPQPADWLHVGSIGATLEPGGSTVLELAQTWPGVVSYDPNCRPLLMGDVLGRVEDLVRASDVVKLSDEDCAWLYPQATQDDVAQHWLALGPSLVVLTRGARGSQAWTRAGTLSLDSASGTAVVDTVGAGDAFMAGLLAGLAGADVQALTTDQVRAAMVLASTVARRTCERPGADPPWADAIT